MCYMLWIIGVFLFAIAASSNLHSEETTSDRITATLKPAPSASSPSGIPLMSSWPYQWSSGNLHIHSTIPDSTVKSTADQLQSLPQEIEIALGVPVSAGNTRIVVLRDQNEFESYLRAHFPHLPSRRALYVQHRSMSLVLTYWHPDWLIDARHECTHALLHESGFKLPLWLDEGLAEYFETNSTRPIHHADHWPAIQAQLRFGQTVQIEEFEQSGGAEMGAKDYRDAWSVVTFLLHNDQATKKALGDYLSDLRTGKAAGMLSRRLDKSTRATWREKYIAFFRASAALPNDAVEVTNSTAIISSAPPTPSIGHIH